MTAPHYQDESIRVYHGDCRDVLAALPDESVDAVVTSPPYAEQRKSTYGGVLESDYPAWTVRWMEPLQRVLKPAGSVLIVIRPHIRDGILSDYILRTRLAVRAAGWAELDELVWFKRDAPPLGRVDRPRRAWESILWFGHNGAAWCDPKANGTPSKRLGFEYSRAIRYGWDHIRSESASITEGIARCTDVAELLINDIPKDGEESAHPALFPPKLAAWCVRLACPTGGTVCDPFMGSGSTGLAAIQEGRQFVGIDIEEMYAAQAARRLAKEPLTLFGGASTA